MKRIETWPALPHEIAFGGFLASTLVRLAGACGIFAPLTLGYAVLLAGVAGLVYLGRTRTSECFWRIRLGYYPLAMNAAYATLGAAVPAFHPGKEDAWLQHLDQLLIGGNASLWLERITHPVLTEILSGCYLFFFPGLIVSWWYYFHRELPVLRAFITGQFTIYGLGFLGYTLVPAVGPYMDPALAGRFTVPLTGGWITRLNDLIVLGGSNKVDVFPSLHCAITAYILFFHLVHAPIRFRWVLVPTLGIWVATIYLRYHYLVDLLVGFTLAAGALWLARIKTSTSPNKS